jgi:hypothetical protein
MKFLENLKNIMFLVVTSFRAVKFRWHFGGRRCLHIQDKETLDNQQVKKQQIDIPYFSITVYLWPWIWRYYVHPKHLIISTGLYGIHSRRQFSWWTNFGFFADMWTSDSKSWAIYSLSILSPTFADRGCHGKDSYGRILGFLDRSRYFFFQVAPRLYSRGWVDPVPDPLLLRISGSPGNRTRTSGSGARNSDY